MNEKKKQKKGFSFNQFFLLSVILLYILLYVFKPQATVNSIENCAILLIRIIPVLLLVIICMGAMDYFVTPGKISRYVGEKSGLKGWILAIFTGIISHGPIYLWYPLLQDLREHGMRNALAAVFLYNRAVKIPLLPLMIYYFGVKFVIILSVFTVFASIIEGKIIETLKV